MPSIKIYSKEQVDDLISGVTPPTVVQTTGSSTTDVMSQNAVTTALGNKADSSAVPTVVQTTGSSTTDVLSQDAVTNALGNKADSSALPTSSQLVPSTSGASSGDVLSFNGSSTEWVAPSGGGGTTFNILNETISPTLIESICDKTVYGAGQRTYFTTKKDLKAYVHYSGASKSAMQVFMPKGTVIHASGTAYLYYTNNNTTTTSAVCAFISLNYDYSTGHITSVSMFIYNGSTQVDLLHPGANGCTQTTTMNVVLDTDKTVLFMLEA